MVWNRIVSVNSVVLYFDTLIKGINLQQGLWKIIVNNQVKFTNIAVNFKDFEGIGKLLRFSRFLPLPPKKKRIVRRFNPARNVLTQEQSSHSFHKGADITALGLKYLKQLT